MRLAIVGSSHDDNAIGSVDDIKRVISGNVDCNDNGAFRKVYFNADRTVVYKVAYSGGDDNNIREFKAMRDLHKCDCGIDRYTTRTTLWMVVESATMIVAMEYIAYDSFLAANSGAIREMVRIVRNHNMHCSGPKVLDLLEDNYRVDVDGNIHITDCNLDENEYSWLIETDHSGRCSSWAV